MAFETFEIVKIFVPATTAFVIGILITPIVTHYLYLHKAWKKNPGKMALDGTEATEFNRIHKTKEGETPRMGGIVIWASVLFTVYAMWVFSMITPSASVFSEMDFFSRSQTWIPLATLLVGAMIGLLNDFYDVRHASGLRLRIRLVLITILSLLIGYWFYIKLEIDSIGIPYDGDLYIGAFIIPLFVLVSLVIYASGTIDGIDGLSGGIFGIIYAAYAMVAYHQGQVDLAAFSATIAGATLAFLWFNIPPARFWMTETGTMALTLTLAVIAFMTDSLGEGIGLAVLPIIAFPLAITVVSTIIQITSKKIRGKKVFRVAPLHHHFEALGWPGYKVTMRYWVIGVIFAILGLIIAVTG